MPNISLPNIPHLLVTHPYCTIRYAYSIWYNICNRRAKALYDSEPRQLSDLQEKLISELKKTGSATTHVDELFSGENPLQKLKAEAERLRIGASKKTGKDFLQYLWDAIPTIDLRNPFARFVLDKRVLDIVNGYMGMWSKFYLMHLNITVPVAVGAKARQSQLWHRDSDDKKICKVFLYLSDVDSNSGPFFSVKESQYGGRWRKLFPQRPPHGSRAPYGKVEKRVPEEYINEFTGRAGTIIFCDTSALHKGGYATGKERIMFTGAFASEASYKYNFFRAIKFPGNFKKILSSSGLSEAARYALIPPEPSFAMRLAHKADSVFDD